MYTSVLIKTSLAIITLAIGTVVLSEYSSPAYSNAAGAPVGKTGSPGDASNCTGCHSGIATSEMGLITSDIPVDGYIPGNTYTITGTIISDGINKFGFEISSQKTTGALKGTLVITNPTETKLIGSGKYVTHTAGGNTGAGNRTWSFDWVAPSAGTGDVTFYGAFIAANGNAANTGDQVFLSNLPVHEHFTTGVEAADQETTEWIIYPDPAKDQIYLKNVDMNGHILSVSVMDVTGKLIKIIGNKEFSKEEVLDVSDLKNGIYVLNILSEKGTAIKKFIKN